MDAFVAILSDMAEILPVVLPIIGTVALASVGWLWRIDRAVAILQVRVETLAESLERLADGMDMDRRDTRERRSHRLMAGD